MLVPAANTLAVSSYSTLLDHYPQLDMLAAADNLGDWDFFMTVAGVGTAFMMIADRVPLDDQRSVSEAVAQELRSWNSQGYAALTDFIGFMKRSVDGGIDLPDAIGTWVIWNLKQGCPSQQELGLARPMGIFLVKAFAQWWDTKK